MNFKSGLAWVAAWIRRSRCQCLLVMVFLCLLLHENYPFSNFPMYSSFSSQTYYLYLTNARGQALETRELGLSSSTLKKIFERFYRLELRKFKRAGGDGTALAEGAAGQSLLRYLDGLSAGRPKVGRLLAGSQVRHVLVRQDAHDLVLETRTLARHP